MLREMLAADELYPNDLGRLRATGFLARHYFIFNRTTWLDETIEHTAKAMLGLTFNCAKCHDHKYDPLSQVAYDQFRAIFEPYQIRTDMLPGQTDFEVDGIPRAFDAHLDVPTWLHVRGDDRQPDKNRTLEPGVPAFLSSDALKLGIEPVSLPIEATYPGLRPFVLTALREAGEQQIIKARAAVDAAKKKFAEAEAAAKELAATTTTPGSSGGSPEITSIKDTGQPASQPVDQARLTVTIAENALKTAAARLASIGARAVADQARFKTPAAGSQSRAKELALAASRTERLVAVSLAEEELSRAEVALLQAAAENTADAENKLSAAKTALRKTLEEIDTPSENTQCCPVRRKLRRTIKTATRMSLARQRALVAVQHWRTG